MAYVVGAAVIAVAASTIAMGIFFYLTVMWTNSGPGCAVSAMCGCVPGAGGGYCFEHKLSSAVHIQYTARLLEPVLLCCKEINPWTTGYLPDARIEECKSS